MTIGRIIVGSSYGDCGKGTVTAFYTKNAVGKVLNVLTNGGAQRGHSVISDNGDFTFKHFGSGTCYGADSYFSQFFILNPMQFDKERKQLANKLPFFDNLKFYRHENCMWTTPFDQMFNLAIEVSRGKDRHGSCGMGIWETVLRYSKMKTYTLDEFCYLPKEFQIKYLKDVRAYFNARNVKLPAELVEPWNSDFLIEHFIQDCHTLRFMAKPIRSITEIYHDYQEVICENGQGLLLNSNPLDDHTTPSNTGSYDGMAILASELHLPNEAITVHYVTRPYLTRHGNGYLIGETDKNYIASSVPEDRTNHYNDTQGHFRYAALDINDLAGRIGFDFMKLYAGDYKVEVTHCDEMDRVTEFGRYFGEHRIHTFESPKV